MTNAGGFNGGFGPGGFPPGPGQPGGQPPHVPPQWHNQPAPVCVRHPDRPTLLTCQRCGQPNCPECLRPATVGFQCVDCLTKGQREVRPVRGLAGGRQRSAPVVTYVLIAINVAVFAITVAMAGSVAYNDSSKLFKDSSLLPLAVADGELWRIVTSGFLHFGPIHLLVNMLALWIVGRDVEIILGRSRYLAVYFASILGGSAAVMMFQNVMSQTAGASGAIFGLFGAQAVILLRIRQSPGPVLTVIALNVFISITLPGISLMGHLGGLAAGVLSTAGILFGPQWLGIGTKPGATPRAVQWGIVLAVIFASLAIIVVRALQLRAQYGL